MGSRKISLSFVNDGKKFTVPYMTVKAQEELLKDSMKLEKKTKDKQLYEQMLNRYMVLRLLQTVDDSITMKDVENMHTNDYYTFIRLVSEKKGELEDDAENFRKKNQ